MQATSQDIFSRSRLLLGDEAMRALSEVRVILFGVGGVGSWCAESLVRTGVTHLTIVDSDCVCASNINRQLMATTLTLGRPKVDALRDHLLTLNPEAQIDARRQTFCAATAADFRLDTYDIIIDAIDSLQDKMLLIEEACRTKAHFFSSMGAALKMDPTRIHVAEFWKVQGCPLARALRQRFKREKRRPARKFPCVYSDELLANCGQPTDNDLHPGKACINGSIMHITAIFGLTLTGLALQVVKGQAAPCLSTLKTEVRGKKTGL